MAEAPVAAGTSEFIASGKRKTAVARVRLRLGSGQFRVNGRSLEDYFQRESLVRTVQQPLELSGLLDRYDVLANLDGSGLSAQAGALQHGIARAIEKLDPGQRIPLKRAGMLRRDARMKERKKYGQRGARARFQFSKR